MPPFLSAAARFMISGALLFFWRRLAGDPRPSKLEWRNAAIVGIFLLVCGNGGVVWAAQFIPSSLSALLVATVPLWMVLIDTLRPGGNQPSIKAMSGILFGLCGAVLLVGWTAQISTAANVYGALAVLAASLFWAIGSIYGKTAALPASPLVTTGIEMMIGGLVQIVVALCFGEFNRFDVAAVSQSSRTVPPTGPNSSPPAIPIPPRSTATARSSARRCRSRLTGSRSSPTPLSTPSSSVPAPASSLTLGCSAWRRFH